jgi:S-adenosylmethionine:tRNA ribosyltransferase-isomerase
MVYLWAKAAVSRMNIDPQSIFIEEFDYVLPQEKIAAFPLEKRDSSKLLVYQKGKIEDDSFTQLPSLLHSNSTIILNNTRVIEARIHFTKATGGVIEIFCLEPDDFADPQQAMMQKSKAVWQCMIGGASKWKPGQVLQKKLNINNVELILEARYISKKEDAFVIEFTWNSDHIFAEVLHAVGAIPLPPYIKRKAETTDAKRYQTIFAEQQGSVAAPTAALHFTEKVFDDLSAKNINKKYVTLHVGAGTFKPVKSETIAEHQMHAESFSVSLGTLQALQNANEIVAVGTTSLRTLESLHWLGVKLIKNNLQEFYLSQWETYELDDNISYKESIAALINHLQQTNQGQIFCRTSLIIVPGYTFKSARALVTNFHQPKSTLLLLVAAFIGEDWKKVYDHALTNNYRFLSYGDSSLLWRKD